MHILYPNKLLILYPPNQRHRSFVLYFVEHRLFFLIILYILLYKHWCLKWLDYSSNNHWELYILLEILLSLWSASSHRIAAFELPSLQPPTPSWFWGYYGVNLVPHCLEIWPFVVFINLRNLHLTRRFCKDELDPLMLVGPRARVFVP